ncbi:hypothetical protein Dsin_004025 [Dipteronia sinensis]|uniref:Uncharacterized protein n=1 Tax=Dipteronia sinensis TaxID=43782 RepID=A0AAE0BAL4_9ROSI|nr:hypothetical protein Dsin_004025 [Dipteronia sinensis]
MEYHNYEEELKKERHLVTILEKEIGYRNQQLSELGHKFNDTKETFLKLIAEQKFKDRRVMVLEQIYRDDISSRDYRLFKLERMYYDSYAIVRQLTSEKSKLQEEYTRVMFGYWENRGKEKQLKWKLQNQTPEEFDSYLKAQNTAMRDQLEENTETLQYLESLNHTLTLKESMSNQELQDARKELISGCLAYVNNETLSGSPTTQRRRTAWKGAVNPIRLRGSAPHGLGIDRTGSDAVGPPQLRGGAPHGRGLSTQSGSEAAHRMAWA